MNRMRLRFSSLLFLLLSVASVSTAQTAASVTSPRTQFGHNIGDDYFLVNYEQMIGYWQKLAQQSNRMKMVRIGTTAAGRPMWMAIITSPENHRKLSPPETYWFINLGSGGGARRVGTPLRAA